MEKVKTVNGNIYTNLDANNNRITNLGFPVNSGDAIRLDYALSTSAGINIISNSSGEIAKVSSLNDLLPKKDAVMKSQLNCKNVVGISGNSADGTVYSDLRPYKVINYGLLKSMTTVFHGKAMASIDMGNKNLINVKVSDVATKQYVDSNKQVTFTSLGLNGTYPSIFYLDMLGLNITANGSAGNAFQPQQITPGDMPVVSATGKFVAYATNLKTFFPGVLPNFGMVSNTMYATNKTNSYLELTSDNTYGVNGTVVLIINIDGTCRYAIDKFTVASGITFIDFIVSIV